VIRETHKQSIYSQNLKSFHGALGPGAHMEYINLSQGCPTFRLWRAALILSLAWRASMQYQGDV